MQALVHHLLRCSLGGERSPSHAAMRDTIYYIIQNAGRPSVCEKKKFLPSSVSRGRGGRAGLVISEPAHDHTLLDVVIANPTRVNLVAQETVVPQHVVLEAKRLKERHYRGRSRGDTFIPIAIDI